jgi:hypothetical protein
MACFRSSWVRACRCERGIDFNRGKRSPNWITWFPAFCPTSYRYISHNFQVAPFGGVKQSGLGREGSKYGMDDYLEVGIQTCKLFVTLIRAHLFYRCCRSSMCAWETWVNAWSRAFASTWTKMNRVHVRVLVRWQGYIVGIPSCKKMVQRVRGGSWRIQ